MAEKFAFYFIVLASLIVVSGCSSPEPKEIDQKYIDSRAYHSFSEQAEQERDQAQNMKVGLTAQLKSLAECSASPYISDPFTIDSTTVATWEDSAENDCLDNSSSRRSPYSLRVLAQSAFKDMKILWILRSRTSIYRDQELFVTTYGDQGLLSAESIGVFRKNLKEKVSTDIKVSSRDNELTIETVENREIRYPLEQNNTIETVYNIDEQGLIKR